MTGRETSICELKRRHVWSVTYLRVSCCSSAIVRVLPPTAEAAEGSVVEIGLADN